MSLTVDNKVIKNWINDILNVCPDELKNGDLDTAFKKYDDYGHYVNSSLTECLHELGYTYEQIMEGMKDTLYHWQFSEVEFDNIVLQIPDNIEYIKSGAFRDCNLEIVYLSKNIKELEYNAFYDCRQLRVVYIPGSIEKINGNFIDGLNNLKKIYIDIDKNSPKYQSIVDQLSNNHTGYGIPVEFNDGTEIVV